MFNINDDTGMRALFKENSVSLESVDFQYNKVFHLALVGAVSTLMNSKLTPSDVKESRIRDIVEEHLGLNIKLLIKENSLGAWTTFPKLSKGHPLVNDYYRGGWTEEDAVDKLSRSKNGVLKGEVDLATSRVSGVFSEVEATIWLGEKLFAKGHGYTAEMIAAVIAHELGHTFQYCILTARLTTTNFIIKSSMDRLFKEKDRTKRIAIINDVESAIGAKFDDKEQLVDVKSKDVYQTLILSKAGEVSRSEMGENIYDYRGFEALADQFAVRHGFAVPLAMAVDKLQRAYGHDSYRSSTVFAFMEVGKLTVFLINLSMGNLLLPLFLLFVNPLVDDYDKPEQRNNRIRGQLTELLKDKSLPKEVREGVLKDIEVIDDLNENVKDKETLREFFWTHAMPSGRRQKASMDLQKDLEELVENELFESAAKLKQMSGVSRV